MQQLMGAESRQQDRNEYSLRALARLPTESSTGREYGALTLAPKAPKTWPLQARLLQEPETRRWRESRLTVCSKRLTWRQSTGGRRCTDICLTACCGRAQPPHTQRSPAPRRSGRANRCRQPSRLTPPISLGGLPPGVTCPCCCWLTPATARKLCDTHPADSEPLSMDGPPQLIAARQAIMFALKCD